MDRRAVAQNNLPAFQAFGKGRLLTIDEQYQILMMRQTAKPKAKKNKPYRMTSNFKLDDDTLVIGKHGISVQKLIQFLQDNKLI